MTQTAAAEVMGLTFSRVGQLEASAMRKLRRALYHDPEVVRAHDPEFADRHKLPTRTARGRAVADRTLGGRLLPEGLAEELQGWRRDIQKLEQLAGAPSLTTEERAALEEAAEEIRHEIAALEGVIAEIE